VGKEEGRIGTSRAGTHAVVVKERPQRGRKDRLSFYWREEMMMREECTAVHTCKRLAAHNYLDLYFSFFFSFFFSDAVHSLAGLFYGMIRLVKSSGTSWTVRIAKLRYREEKKACPAVSILALGIPSSLTSRSVTKSYD